MFLLRKTRIKMAATLQTVTEMTCLCGNILIFSLSPPILSLLKIISSLAASQVFNWSNEGIHQNFFSYFIDSYNPVSNDDISVLFMVPT